MRPLGRFSPPWVRRPTPSASSPRSGPGRQYHLRLQTTTTCYFVLTQSDVRGTAAPLRHIHLLVAYKEGRRVQRVHASERMCSSGKYINLRQVVAEASLSPRAQPYTVFVSTYEPGQETGFVLAVHSDLPVSLTPIAPEEGVGHE